MVLTEETKILPEGRYEGVLKDYTFGRTRKRNTLFCCMLFRVEGRKVSCYIPMYYSQAAIFKVAMPKLIGTTFKLKLTHRVDKDQTFMDLAMIPDREENRVGS